MRIRMTRDHDVALDGINIQRLKQGGSYDVPERFANRWLEKGIAVEDKAIDKAPETKTKKTTRKRKK